YKKQTKVKGSSQLLVNNGPYVGEKLGPLQ
ncbi:unnamed protein product, partial [marine sediment metagenome]